MTRKFLVPVVLPADPANPLEAATKQYVDANAGGGTDEVWVDTTEPTDPAIELWYDPDAVSGEMAASMQLWTWEGAPMVRLPSELAVGEIGVNAAPSTATELYVHHTDSSQMIDWSTLIARLVAGDLVYLQHSFDATSWHRYRLTGVPTLSGAIWTIPVTTDGGSAPGTEPAVGQPVLLQLPVVDGLPTGGTTGQVLSKSSSADWAAIWVTPSWLDSIAGDARYVNLTGDTMSGSLILPADPIAAMEAATKQYVDGRSYDKASADARFVNVAGDLMTGHLKVEQQPTFDLTTYPGGSLQIGGNSGSTAPVNMILYGEGIQGRTLNGAGAPNGAWPLYLQRLGQALRVGDHTVTDSSLQLLGAFPTGCKLRFYSGGQEIGALFPYGNTFPVDLVLQNYATYGNDIALQAIHSVAIDGNGKRSGEFRDGILWVGNITDATGNSPQPLRIYGTSTQDYIGFYHGAAPQSRSGYVGFNTSSEMRVINEISGGLVSLYSNSGDVRIVSNGQETMRCQDPYILGGINSSASADVAGGIWRTGQYFLQGNQVVNTPIFVANKNGAGVGAGHDFMHFRNNSTTIGSIQRNGTTAGVVYNTTSDYRLKHDRGEITGALERIKLLTPRRVVWKEDETQTEMDGFFAHEVATAVPEAVTGEKDAVAGPKINDTDPVEGTIVAQQLDASKLIPLLVATVKELSAKVDALSAELAELKGAA